MRDLVSIGGAVGQRQASFALRQRRHDSRLIGCFPREWSLAGRDGRGKPPAKVPSLTPNH